MPFHCRARIVSAKGTQPGPVEFVRRGVASVRWVSAATEEAVQLYDDGAHDDAAARDGLFGGTALVREPGTYTYNAVFRVPFSPRLSTTGAVEMPENPVEVRLPGVFARLLAGMSGRPAHVRLMNRTSLNLRVAFASPGTGAETETTVSLPAGGTASAAIRARGHALRMISKDLEVRIESKPDPVWTGRLSIPPWGLAPATILFAMVGVGLGFLVPQRSTARLQLVVSLNLTDDTMPMTRMCNLDSDGLPTWEGIPGDFGRPGQFRPRSGFWRTGILYKPASWLRPSFAGRPPKRAANGWIVKNGTMWTATGAGGKARYTIQAPGM